MRVVIIGSGNVATVMGRLIKKKGHEISQVVSRTPANAQLLATEIGCASTDSYGGIDITADIYLVAIADGALNELNESFHIGNKLVIHTAGSVSKDALKMVSLNYGVIYPMQSLRKDNNNIPAIPFLIDGNTEESIALIEAFASSLSGTVSRATDEERLKFHISAVIVSNFSNHLYALAADYCAKEGLDFSMLQPLIEETALRLRHYTPAEMQTGPAIRKDIFTLDKHLRLLSAHPRLRNIYLKITDSIINA